MEHLPNKQRQMAQNHVTSGIVTSGKKTQIHVVPRQMFCLRKLPYILYWTATNRLFFHYMLNH